MKLHPAVTGKTMKYPRAANAALDVGMVLMIVGAASAAAAALGMLSDPFFESSIGALVVGLLCFGMSKYVAAVKIEVLEKNPTAPILKRVK